MYVIFLVRTDTMKDGAGDFVAVYDNKLQAEAKVKELNTVALIEDSLMYVVCEVILNNIHEGARLARERMSY